MLRFCASAIHKLVPDFQPLCGTVTCRALLATFKHNLNDALKEAAKARKHRDLVAEATYLMVETYLQPVVDSLWEGKAIAQEVSVTTVATCDRLLSGMDARERSTTRWQVI